MKNLSILKKMLLLALSAAMLLTVLTGCGSGETAAPQDEQATEAQAEEQPAAEASTLLEQIKAKGKLVVGTEAQYAPYEFKDLDANFVGCDMWLGRSPTASALSLRSSTCPSRASSPRCSPVRSTSA